MKKLAYTVVLLIFLIPHNAFSENESIDILTSWPPNKVTLEVTIINYANLDKDSISIIKNVIESDSHYSKNGSIYFEGWAGALASLGLGKTQKFEISESTVPHGDIIIDLLKDEKSSYGGYTVPYYTKNHISAATIDIYNSNNLSSSELESVVRHEFGHSLGLGHSTKKNSAMYEFVFGNNYIEECDLAGLGALYHHYTYTKVNC